MSLVDTPLKVGRPPDPASGAGDAGHLATPLQPTAIEAPQPARAAWWAIALLLLTLWFGGLGLRDLFHPDEGRYAEIPREMVATGDYVMPRLDGLKYYEKPPLAYWLTAATYQLVGVNPASARFASALCGAFTVLAVALTARRVAGASAGLLAGLALAGGFQFFVFSQVLTVDMVVTCFLTLSLTSLILASDTRLSPGRRRGWTLAVWASMGLAVLAKGLIGIVLPVLVLGLYLVSTRHFALLRRLQIGWGLLLCALIAAPWFLALQGRDPAFFDFFFVQQHFNRFTQGAYRTGGWYFFLLLFVVGALPWTLNQLRALGAAWRAPTPATFDLQVPRLLLLWVVVVVGFFSLSKSKLPGYIVPAFPAVALLLGLIAAQRPALMRAPVAGLMITGLLFGALAGTIEFLHFSGRGAANRWIAVLEPYGRWLALAALVALATAWLCQRWRRRPMRAVITAGCGALLAFQVAILGSQSLAPMLSSRPLVEEAEATGADFAPPTPFFSVGVYDQTLPPTIGRTVTIIDYGDELRMGLWAEPHLTDTLEGFRARWQAAPQAYAMLSTKALEREQGLGLPMVVLARNERAAIVARTAPRPAPAPAAPAS